MSFTRQDQLGAISDGDLDVLVVGGGITGAGIALDLALRGISVALVERSDFASGTSSRSSQLIHGGLRYLRNGHMALVKESLAERTLLLKNAPDLVQPIQFLLPIFETDSWLTEHQLGFGLGVYDALGARHLGRHRTVSEKELRERTPGLSHAKKSFLFADAHTDDTRLTLSIIKTACDYGASACNYLSFDRSEFHNDAWRVTLTDRGVEKEVRCRAKVIVNATGVWTSEVVAKIGGIEKSPIRASKGVHIALAASKFSTRNALVLRHPRDGRVVFVIPSGDFVYVGTTDTDYFGPLDHVDCELSEAEYLLEVFNSRTTTNASVGDITGSWAGIRPLAAATNKDVGDVSRKHVIREGPGTVQVIGGKLTTYRHIASQVSDRVAKQLGVNVKCATRDCRIDPAYDPASPSDFTHEPDAMLSLFETTMCEHLTDLFVRRTKTVPLNAAGLRNVSGDAVNDIAELLSWNTDRVGDEKSSLEDAISSSLRPAKPVQ